MRPSGNNLAGPSPSLPSCSSPDVPTHLREPPLQSLGLHRAAGAGDVSLVLFALENGQQVNQTIHGISPLHVAACMGFVPVINVLLAYGADVNIPKGKTKWPDLVWKAPHLYTLPLLMGICMQCAHFSNMVLDHSLWTAICRRPSRWPHSISTCNVPRC